VLKRTILQITFGLLNTVGCGCSGQPYFTTEPVLLARGAADEAPDPCNGTAEQNRTNDADKPKKPPRTLFEWSIGPEGTTEPDEKDEIVTDRPDFTESSSTVGRGRVQLESGYTYFHDHGAGTRIHLHSFPEGLLRFGVGAEWFEGRIGWNYFNQRTKAEGFIDSPWGAADLYLGVKLGLTEQKAYLPETALIVQMFVPTGAEEFTGNRVLPGFNYLFGWDVSEFLSLGGSFQMNRTADDVGHPYLQVAQSLTVGYHLTQKWGAYTEWFAFYPDGAVAPGVGPEHYFDGGFTYKVTKNLQLDWRAGIGLNEHAVDYFAGAGLSMRY
jgi:Putative MetA-pathway of phenol degradation